MEKFLKSKFVKCLLILGIGFFVIFSMYHAFAFANGEYDAMKWSDDVRTLFSIYAFFIAIVDVFIVGVVAVNDEP